MPLQPWHPKISSTPTPSSSLHSRDLRSNVPRCPVDEDNKENRQMSRRREAGISTKKWKKTQKTPNMLSRRNERERNRVHLLNLGFDRLRAVVPKREGEHLSKISTLKKAIWYIEHLDRVLHEEVAPEVADSGVVGTDLGGGSVIATPSGHQVQQQEQLEEGEERLSPIFPARMDEPSTEGPSLSLHYMSPTPDSGYGSSFYAMRPQEPPPPPVRMWTIDIDSTSTPEH
ncbi:unnamed protein product [Taenia asiatica]|uniref:BHLH domain-containing protein n=1 Tax=Taenia asiatica TaxID=60517 RepID=A0A0R3WDF0_TAEAS|nr:unnamed protein product [Taenia asiatica]